MDEPDASYDAVLMMDVIEHLERPAAAVAEAARALKSGGVLLFHTFNRTVAAWLLAVKGIGFVTREGPSNVHSYGMFVTPAELEAADAPRAWSGASCAASAPCWDGPSLGRFCTAASIRISLSR